MNVQDLADNEESQHRAEVFHPLYIRSKGIKSLLTVVMEAQGNFLSMAAPYIKQRDP